MSNAIGNSLQKKNLIVYSLKQTLSYTLSILRVSLILLSAMTLKTWLQTFNLPHLENHIGSGCIVMISTPITSKIYDPRKIWMFSYSL